MKVYRMFHLPEVFITNFLSKKPVSYFKTGVHGERGNVARLSYKPAYKGPELKSDSIHHPEHPFELNPQCLHTQVLFWGTPLTRILPPREVQSIPATTLGTVTLMRNTMTRNGYLALVRAFECILLCSTATALLRLYGFFGQCEGVGLV